MGESDCVAAGSFGLSGGTLSSGDFGRSLKAPGTRSEVLRGEGGLVSVATIPFGLPDAVTFTVGSAVAAGEGEVAEPGLAADVVMNATSFVSLTDVLREEVALAFEPCLLMSTFSFLPVSTYVALSGASRGGNERSNPRRRGRVVMTAGAG